MYKHRGSNRNQWKSKATRARYSLVELYSPDSVGKEVMVDEGADVTVPESDDIDAIDETVESNEKVLDNVADVVASG